MTQSAAPMRFDRRQAVYFVLGGFFLTNAILGELTGGKLIALPAVDWGWIKWREIALSIGVIPWPVVFITTDLINEYFGKSGVRRLTYLACVMIVYAFIMLFAAIRIPAWSASPVSDEQFTAVFGQSQWIIVGSLTAFLVSQLMDVTIFTAVRRWTGSRWLWARATGSTVISQLFDTFLVGFIAFVVPGKLAMSDFLSLAVGSYLFKLAVAVAITPVIYLGHGIIDRFLEADSPRTQPSST